MLKALVYIALVLIVAGGAYAIYINAKKQKF